MFRNDSLSIFGAFIWKEIRKGAQINRGMGKLISIIRGSREMKGLEMILEVYLEHLFERNKKGGSN